MNNGILLRPCGELKKYIKMPKMQEKTPSTNVGLFYDKINNNCILLSNIKV